MLSFGLEVEEYEEIQGRPSAPSRSHARMQNIGMFSCLRDKKIDKEKS
jgi:hypothetical protein